MNNKTLRMKDALRTQIVRGALQISHENSLEQLADMVTQLLLEERRGKDLGHEVIGC